MHGANFESAREEMGLDHVARTPRPNTGLYPAASPRDLTVRMVTFLTDQINYNRLASAA